jgi:hypothetical protein
MNSVLYKEIIERVIFPFSIEKFNGQMNLHQDNDPKHTSKLCIQTMEAFRVNWV